MIMNMINLHQGAVLAISDSNVWISLTVVKQRNKFGILEEALHF